MRLSFKRAGGMSSAVTLETVRLLALLKKAQSSSPELAAVAREWLSGQWALLVVACVALLLLMLLLSFRNESRRKDGTAKATRKEAKLWAHLFNLAKTSYKTAHMEELVAELIRSKVDVEKYTEPGTGLTLLLCACLCGQKMLVEFLLSRGANCFAVTSDGDTALLLATYACCTVKGADLGLLDLLACRGVNVNAQNCRGDSPLSMAGQHGRTELLSMLLQYGADSHIPNKGGILPVDFAGYSGNHDAAKLLENHMTLKR